MTGISNYLIGNVNIDTTYLQFEAFIGLYYFVLATKLSSIYFLSSAFIFQNLSLLPDGSKLSSLYMTFSLLHHIMSGEVGHLNIAMAFSKKVTCTS